MAFAFLSVFAVGVALGYFYRGHTDSVKAKLHAVIVSDVKLAAGDLQKVKTGADPGPAIDRVLTRFKKWL